MRLGAHTNPQRRWGTASELACKHFAYLDQTPLYNQSMQRRLGSPRNQPLVDKMPSITSVRVSSDGWPYPWQAFIGPGTAFEPGGEVD